MAAERIQSGVYHSFSKESKWLELLTGAVPALPWGEALPLLGEQTVVQREDHKAAGAGRGATQGTLLGSQGPSVPSSRDTSQSTQVKASKARCLQPAGSRRKGGCE